MGTTKKKKVAIICITTLLMFLSVGVFSEINTQACSDEPVIPTYSLYCENSELIKNGCVNFDFTDDELFLEGECSKKSEYQVSAANREVEFAIPFVSSAINLPDIAVTVNKQEVKGTVWYGNSGHWSEYEFDIDKTYSPILDESIMGTLYTFFPDSDTISVSLSLNKSKSYIYETTNYYSSSDTADGSHTWTLKEAIPFHEYSFFIFGDSSECTFESSCGYKTETVSCKEFLDNQYKKFKDYYDQNGGVPIELFYSIANRILKENISISYDEVFLRSIDTYSVNAYKFKLTLEKDSVICYELPANIHTNYDYKPYVYYVEQRQVGSYPVSYSIMMRNDIPYIIESSEAIEKESITYKAKTAEDFDFYFSASEKPIEIHPLQQLGLSHTLLIICIVCGVSGGVAFIILVINLFFIIRSKKKAK